MQIWNYRPTTGELLGPSAADPDPMAPGEWIVPAHATAADPGAPQPGYARVFNGAAWSSVPDHRGETWWQTGAEFNTAPILIGAIGDPTTFDPPLTNVEPPAPPAPPPPPVIVTPWQIRKALSELGLRAAVEAYVAAADQDTKDGWQFATEFEHGHSMIETAATALGKAPADVDALFALAKTL